MKLHLVSFKTCPYVQRSIITLQHKGVPFDVTYIDLADPPEWFTQKSPLGKVPIVEVTDDEGTTTVLFESAVINEFVDEVTEGSLLPSDPVAKARARGWIEFASECNVDYYYSAIAKDQADHEKHAAALIEKLSKVEQQLAGTTFLDEFSLVDTGFAPVLQRITRLENAAPAYSLTGLPKVSAWRDHLLSLAAVQDSIVADWPDLEMDYIKSTGGYIAAVAA